MVRVFARLLARSFPATLLSIAVSVSSRAGLAASYIFDIAPSGAMVLAAAVVFAIVSIGKRAAPRTLRQEEHA
jgi:ABC-type Mn2+/Zn2+ transport system permease subunit